MKNIFMLNYLLYEGEENTTEIKTDKDMCDFRRSFIGNSSVEVCKETPRDCFEKKPCNVEIVNG